MRSERVALVGYRGTGKSTVGRLVADALGWAFVDADAELESRAGRSVREIFAEQGEPAFREMESAVLADLLARERLVLATGGGVVLRADNRERLRGAFVVWLTASVEVIDARLCGDPSTAARRPALTGLPAREEIVRLLAEREPLYREVADAVVDAADPSPDAVASRILAAWNPSSPSASSG